MLLETRLANSLMAPAWAGCQRGASPRACHGRRNGCGAQTGVGAAQAGL